MKYFCKIIYKDKIEPTIYFKNKSGEEAKKEMVNLTQKLFESDDIEGIYLGKKK